MEWGSLLPTFIGSLPGVAALVAVLLKGKAESNKFKADAASALVTSAVDLSEAKDKQIVDYRAVIASHEDRIKQLEETVRMLEEQILELGHTPRNRGVPLGKKR
jgi:predicted ATP-grasp superfamily ATP-dependent carboligase